MTRTNVLYLVIGALAVAVVVLSYQLYQDHHQPEGVHIELGRAGCRFKEMNASSARHAFGLDAGF